jgi:hypothetical protein
VAACLRKRRLVCQRFKKRIETRRGQLALTAMPFTFGSPDFFDEQVQRMTRAGHRSQVHVLLHSTNGNDGHDPGATECIEPFAAGGNTLWLCRLPDKLRDALYKACEPRGEPPEEAYGTIGQLYTVALFMGPLLPGTIASWDGYGYITKFVSYSQLVHPTSIGFGNTAVLYFDDTGTFTSASAGPCRGITEHAFIVPDSRNWLSKEECETIKLLFDTADLDKLPDRVARAHWSVQHAAYQYFFEVRTMLVASGLDALLHVWDSKPRIGTGKQFTDRTVLLAQELGINLTPTDAKALWEHRSDVSHGRDPWHSVRDHDDPKWQMPKITKNEPWVKRYLLGDEILRRTVLKCLTDSQFAAKFASDDTVAAAYPVKP